MIDKSVNIFVDEQGIIQLHPVGDQTEETISAVGDKAREIIARTQAEHKQVLVLDDLRGLGTVTPGARRMVINLGRTLQFDKLAMLGKPGSLIRVGANLLLAAMGQRGRTRYFDNQDEAIEWLLQ